MTKTDIVSYIDDFLEDNQGFLSGHVIDFALDVRSFVTSLDREPELVEAA